MRSVVLPESTAQRLSQLCSRPGPPAFEGTWLPSESDVKVMESNFSKIASLKSSSGYLGAQIKHPEKYNRQYVGIIIKEKKWIYINGICNDDPPEWWKEKLIDVCDGGCNWGVIYNTATREFSNLEMNGV
jgi:hypothetical protein